MTPMEKAFLQHAEQIVNDRLHDAAFSVEALSRMAGYSRSQMHRKLKQLTGLTVRRFIKRQRLQRAAGWLKTRPMSVEQIAGEIGFSSVSYFRRCFKTEYGVTPGEYVRENN
ncbi:helix-turn-helix transcriptional regulator [bacterium]|nr:helix-turn-helix transcriptional regulator [bacterium]